MNLFASSILRVDSAVEQMSSYPGGSVHEREPIETYKGSKRLKSPAPGVVPVAGEPTEIIAVRPSIRPLKALKFAAVKSQLAADGRPPAPVAAVQVQAAPLPWAAEVASRTLRSSDAFPSVPEGHRPMPTSAAVPSLPPTYQQALWTGKIPGRPTAFVFEGEPGPGSVGQSVDARVYGFASVPAGAMDFEPERMHWADVSPNQQRDARHSGRPVFAPYRQAAHAVAVDLGDGAGARPIRLVGEKISKYNGPTGIPEKCHQDEWQWPTVHCRGRGSRRFMRGLKKLRPGWLRVDLKGNKVSC